VRKALLLVALTACPGGGTSVFSASYTLDGQPRAVDDRAGGRVTCAVDSDPRDAIDPAPVLTLAVTSSSDGHRAPGLYFTVHAFHGAGSYRLGTDRGQAIVFDSATLGDCARADDTRCFSTTESCTLELTEWSLGDPGTGGARVGTGAGTFTCDTLLNATSRDTVRVQAGTFSCRASDWTGARH